jgi:hypothetical protein
MDFRHTYPDYVKLVGDRLPPKHDPYIRVRKPRGIRRWRR